MNRHSRSVHIKALAAAMSLLVIVQLRPASGAPGDIFTIAAPVLGAEPPKAADLHVGDSSVSTQTGAYRYTYPIEVPPGRNGMAPHLSLTYSSQGAIYGGIAAGWELAVPWVQEDTTNGRLRTLTGTSGPMPTETIRYQSSLAGSQPFVKSEEPPLDTQASAVYRAQGDAEYLRFELGGSDAAYRWHVFAPNGHEYIFGEASHVNNCANISDRYAPLTSESDEFGNTVQYYWAPAASTGFGADDCHLTTVTWGANAKAGIPDFAQVIITYGTANTCTTTGIPVGSATDYRLGFRRVQGSARLTAITAFANDPSTQVPAHQRHIALKYYDGSDSNLSPNTEGCGNAASAFRQLASIQESAWTSDPSVAEVDLPKIEFAYGAVAPSNKVTTHSLLWGGGGDPYLDYSLTWGYRRAGEWPTVEAMLLDVDGDGLPDRVRSSPVMNGSHIVSCRAQWQRNRGVGTDGLQSFDPTLRDIPLPTLKWGDVPSHTGYPYQGGDYANQQQAASHERCALNYQATNYVNSTAGGFICGPNDNVCPTPDAPFTVGMCNNKNDCATDGSPTPTILSYRWMDVDGDGLVDIVASIAQGSLTTYDLQQGHGVPGYLASIPTEPALFGPFPACPTYAPREQIPGKYTMCHGFYPAFVYKNHGNASFGTVDSSGHRLPDAIDYLPVPVETESADSSITSAVAATDFGMLDVDGDGVTDAVMGNVLTGDPDWWRVYRGDGNGGVVGDNFGAQRVQGFAFGNGYFSEHLNLSFPNNSAVRQQIGFLDINGDGLVDHWKETGSGAAIGANVEVNDGRTFISVAQMGLVDTAVPLGTASLPVVQLAGSGANPFIFEGQRYDTNRVADVDQDGRLDVLQWNGTGPTVAFNQGGQYGASVPYTGDEFAMMQWMQVSDVDTPDYTWEVRSDLVDLDGDGIPEAVDFALSSLHQTNPQNATFVKISTPTQPPRLLTQVKNNRGATTSVTYAQVHDGVTVTQHPETGHSTPRPQWVVKSLTTHEDISNTTAVTTYSYLDPVSNRDTLGHWGFRGYAEVHTLHPSGSQTVERYDYSPDRDWSGRLSSTVAKASDSEGGAVETIDDFHWQTYELCVAFGDRVCDSSRATLKSYHQAETDHWICKAGQGEAACRANTDGFTATSTSYTLWKSNGPLLNGRPTLYVPTLVRLATSPHSGDVAGDRLVETDYDIKVGDGAYRVRPKNVTHELVTTGRDIYAKSRTGWDSTLSVPNTTETWFDAQDSSRAIERRVYDMNTGNLIERWKPVQEDANEHQTSSNAAYRYPTRYTYDSRQLFVAVELREPSGPAPAQSMEFDYVWDYGLGRKVATLGPNVRTCSPSNCINDAYHPAKEEQLDVLDPFGRVLEHWMTYASDQAPNYLLYQTQVNTYHFGTSSTDPSYVDTKNRRDVTPGVYAMASDSILPVHTRDEYDGLGRPSRKTIDPQGQAPNAAVTTFHYRDDGTLRDVSVPNPTTNDTSTVTYTYTFDSLGRPASMRRPDASTASNQSGVNISYDGLVTTTDEVAGVNGGSVSHTRRQKDAFGRTIEIDELDGAATYSTMYEFAPDDNVSEVDAPGNGSSDRQITTMTHDFAGHRTSVTRGSHTWLYSYDLNGNVSSETLPGWTDPSDAINFTTTFVYDNLDRIASKHIGAGELSSSDQTLFGDSDETYVWDYGTYHKNFLTYWKAFAPNATTPSTTITNLGDMAEREDRWTHTIAIPGLPTITHEVESNLYINGMPRITQFNDQVGGANYTYQQNVYDYRGMPLRVDLYRSETGLKQIAVNTRNVAGLVTHQHTAWSGSVITVDDSWNYDAIGRVTSQVVQHTASGTTYTDARQDVSYFGQDDPSSMDMYLGASSHKHFTYGYDARHQLSSVNEASTPSAFGATYTFGPGGRFKSASEHSDASLPGNEVRARDVQYEYGDSDPERLTALTTNHLPYASYTYDAAGNQLSRCYGTPAGGTCSNGLTTYVYDIKNQLRRATSISAAGIVQGSEEYWYDNDGTRIAKLRRNGSGVIVELIRFNHGAERHYDGGGNLVHTYSYITMGPTVARVDRTSNTSSDLEYTFHGLGNNVLASLDADGTTNAAFSYSPYGEVVETIDRLGPSGQSVDAHRRRLNDKYVDEVTSLAYYGARYYDDVSITWTQTDPLSISKPEIAPRRSNLYTFSLNNPLRYLDPDGRSPKSIDVNVVNDTLDGRYNSLAAEVHDAVERTWSPGGSIGTIVAFAGTTVNVSALGDGGKTPIHLNDVEVALFNSSDQASIDQIGVNYGKSGKDFVNFNPGELANADRGGRFMAVAMDRLEHKVIKKFGKSLKDPSKWTPADLEKLRKYLDDLVSHEGGHLAGACHEADCKSKSRPKEEVMSDDFEKDDSEFQEMRREWSRNDVDKIYMKYGAH